MPAPPFIIPSSSLDRRKLGKYDVICRISTGGMSEIYLAHQLGVGGFRKLVVLKTILPDIGGEEDFVRMFLDEARITAGFNNPNIAQVFELAVDAGVLFMSMEFVQGCTLVEMAKACRQAKEPIPLGFTLASVRDTALALHYAHNFTDARGRKNVVIHRDVAEKNVMVTYDGVTKLLDFGIAKALGARSGHTHVGMVKGTSGYMSPEQIRGEPLDGRSDIFSLGVVLHECLTGMRLFHGKNLEDGMLAALHEDVEPPSRQNRSVPAEVDAVVLKALARDRAARFSTALEMARALEKAAPGLIWHPEQSGELVSRHFADRRAETRRVLDAEAKTQEPTGEIRIESLLARVKASGERAGASTEAGAPAAAPLARPKQPSDSQQLPASAATPPIPPPRSALSPPPQAAPRTSSSPPPQAPPRTSSSPPPQALPLRPKLEDFDDDDESEAKTIPAAALPEELRALRDRIRQRHEGPKAAAPPGVPPLKPGVVPRLAGGVTDENDAVTIAVRSNTGETLSITGRVGRPGPPPDEEEATAHSRHGRQRESAPPTDPARDLDLEEPPSRTWLFVVLLVVLLAITAAGTLFLLDLPPFAALAR